MCFIFILNVKTLTSLLCVYDNWKRAISVTMIMVTLSLSPSQHANISAPFTEHILKGLAGMVVSLLNYVCATAWQIHSTVEKLPQDTSVFVPAFSCLMTCVSVFWAPEKLVKFSLYISYRKGRLVTRAPRKHQNLCLLVYALHWFSG